MKVEIKDLLEAGAHFGHKSEKWNPKMAPFIFGKKSGIHIIDLTKTKEEFEKALEFVGKIAQEDKVILFVGTKKQAQQIIKQEAEKAGMPYVNERWLGGTLTNFQTIIKQVKKLNSLREEKTKGEWEKFSKKEKSVKQKELEKLEKSIGGLENLSGLPDVLYIVDITKEYLALKEARRLEIPVVGIVDSNADPNQVNYPIPANDDALKVIHLFTEKIADTILENKSQKTDEKNLQKVEKEEEKEKKKKKVQAGEEEIKEEEIKEDIEEIEEKLKEEIEEEKTEVKKITKTSE